MTNPTPPELPLQFTIQVTLPPEVGDFGLAEIVHVAREDLLAVPGASASLPALVAELDRVKTSLFTSMLAVVTQWTADPRTPLTHQAYLDHQLQLAEQRQARAAEALAESRRIADEQRKAHS